MGNKSRDHIVILKTGKLHELDMATNLLSEKEIPFYKECENSSGLRMAMPFQPSMGPGEWYSVLVHKNIEDKAKEELKNLPFEITTEPDIWNFGANEKSKKGWRIYAWILLLAGLLFFIQYLYDLFLHINK